MKQSCAYGGDHHVGYTTEGADAPEIPNRDDSLVAETSRRRSSAGTRRQFLAGAAAAGAAGALGFPAIHVKAATTGDVKFGLLEDQSGNFALFGFPPH